MQLLYQQYRFEFSFAEKIRISLSSVSTFRSILGMSLKSMCCIAKNNECENCLYSQTCVYCSLFESIISKENQILKGRNTAPHPYMLSVERNDEECSDEIILKITLFGKYIEYFPYIYGAFVRSGQKGFGKNRIPFTVQNVTVDGESIIEDEERVKTDVPVKVWKSSDSNVEKNGEILVKLKTPFRYKSGGKLGGALANQIEVKDFMNCLYRRAKTLCGFYGDSDGSEEFDVDNCQFSVSESNVRWKENTRYSARQKTEMSLGGMIGEFTLQGNFSQQDLDLIEFARIFGAGKNTNFGLGQIDVWERIVNSE